MEMLTVKWVQRPLVTLGIICLFIGVMPDWQHVSLKGLPDGKTETKDIITIGISPSPLLLLERTHSEQMRDTGVATSDSKGFRLEFVSWSTLALVVGAMFLVADRWWGKSPVEISGK
jgi:hypothetical protein